MTTAFTAMFCAITLLREKNTANHCERLVDCSLELVILQCMLGCGFLISREQLFQADWQNFCTPCGPYQVEKLKSEFEKWLVCPIRELQHL